MLLNCENLTCKPAEFNEMLLYGGISEINYFYNI